MKKIIALIIALSISLLAISSCNLTKKEDDEHTVIKIGYMAGPTGMGLAKLIHDQKSNENLDYEFTMYTDASLATADLVAGKIDMACVPTNTAAALSNRTNGKVQTLAINCLNSLYFMQKSTSDIKIDDLSDLEGKTVYTLKNGTPSVILNQLISKSGLNITVATSYDDGNGSKEIVTPNDLASLLIAGSDIEIALVPEPVATAVPIKINAAGKDYTYKTVIDLGVAWNEYSSSPVAMGCLIANSEFAKEHRDDINTFLDDYKASVDFITDTKNIDAASLYIEEAGILEKAAIAKKSLSNLGDAITYVDGDAMHTILVEFYNAIGLNLIGGKLPDDAFYYKK